MGHLDAPFVEPASPFLGTAGRGEYHGYFLLSDDFHQFGGLGTHQRHVDTEVVTRSLAALDDVLSQHFRSHGSGTYQAQSASIAHGCSKFPPAAPHHTA